MNSDQHIANIIRTLQEIHLSLAKLLSQKNMEENNKKKFYDTAISCLGKDITPKDEVSDSVACAATINAIHKKAFGFEIGGGASTYNLYRALLNSPFFVKVDVPEQGAVVISPSGYGNGRLTNGHVGIMDDKGGIMSNDSADGIFKKNFTLISWRARYQKIGGFPINYFRRI